MEKLNKYTKKVKAACPDGSTIGFNNLKMMGLVCYKLDALVEKHVVLLNGGY